MIQIWLCLARKSLFIYLERCAAHGAHLEVPFIFGGLSNTIVVLMRIFDRPIKARLEGEACGRTDFEKNVSAKMDCQQCHHDVHKGR
jgi:hypothetical protein